MLKYTDKVLRGMPFVPTASRLYPFAGRYPIRIAYTLVARDSPRLEYRGKPTVDRAIQFKLQFLRAINAGTLLSYEFLEFDRRRLLSKCAENGITYAARTLIRQVRPWSELSPNYDAYTCRGCWLELRAGDHQRLGVVWWPGPGTPTEEQLERIAPYLNNRRLQRGQEPTVWRAQPGLAERDTVREPQQWETQWGTTQPFDDEQP